VAYESENEAVSVINDPPARTLEHFGQAMTVEKVKLPTALRAKAEAYQRLEHDLPTVLEPMSNDDFVSILEACCLAHGRSCTDEASKFMMQTAGSLGLGENATHEDIMKKLQKLAEYR
jgi:uncharacterized protein YuzB (UPF0349 family)